ncbi:hypothetical protein HPP92_007675 [Vanilla planifolia]|uniref:Uncharacterized protein n=1 Tax=Vanilla planifolia TaxID=51239 RepID=A0A835RRM7_VANPL|nr:hypothetical protein HPP92_007675 [Vanilla planifolia]
MHNSPPDADLVRCCSPKEYHLKAREHKKKHQSDGKLTARRGIGEKDHTALNDQAAIFYQSEVHQSITTSFYPNVSASSPWRHLLDDSDEGTNTDCLKKKERLLKQSKPVADIFHLWRGLAISMSIHSVCRKRPFQPLVRS